MANTRDIRRRIKSVKSTAQITKAMQMAGGPVAKLSGAMGTYREAMATGYGPTILMSGAVGILAAAIVASVVAAAAAAAAFFKWTVGTADAARSLNLLQGKTQNTMNRRCYPQLLATLRSMRSLWLNPFCDFCAFSRPTHPPNLISPSL